MFIAQLNHPSFGDTDLSSLRTGVMAGSPCPIEVMKQVRDRMHIPEITICYGMTETSPVSTQTQRDDPVERQVSTVGRVHPHVEIQIVNTDTGQVVPRDESGELCTRGYCVMLGYWNNQSATQEAIDADGWMHTRDLATMDADGYVRIIGRLGDMIIRGGDNIYPREVEEFLYTHPDIEDAQVIGVPSEMYGEEVMAWIKVKAGASAAAVTDDALVEFCRGQIATTKIPRYWKRVDSFPMTVTAKIQKFRMRELAIEELGLADGTWRPLRPPLVPDATSWIGLPRVRRLYVLDEAVDVPEDRFRKEDRGAGRRSSFPELARLPSDTRHQLQRLDRIGGVGGAARPPAPDRHTGAATPFAREAGPTP